MPLRWTQRLARLIRCQRGVSAVEFSILAPFLVTAGLSTADAGMAIYDKMMITQVLRSGAHSAIAAESEAQMLAILEATAGDNFTLAEDADDPEPGELRVGVTSYCICPDDPATQVPCDEACTSGAATQGFYRLSAVVEFDGVMLPSMMLDGSIDVIAQ